MTDSKNVRIVHEGSWEYPGGAERVARELAHAFDAPVTVGHTGNKGFWQEVDLSTPFQQLNDSRILSKLPQAIKELYLALLFRTVEFEEDVVITSGTTAKWWSPRADQTHIHYCHSPPTDVFCEPANSVIDSGIKTTVGVVDQFFASLCDKILANSEFTADRVSTYYSRESEVVHPPIDTDAFYHAEPDDQPYFVMIGRLEPMKRSDLVSEAFEGLDTDLLLIGDGPLRDECARRENVRVRTNVSDTELADLVAHSVGGIAFAEREHCGMTPKEFHAAGKPVIVPDEPNLKNHVEDGVNGSIVDISVRGVRKGVETVLDESWNMETIQRASESWSTNAFQQRIREIVSHID